MTWPQVNVVCGLNTRETALVVWTVAFGIWALTKADVRAGVISLLKILFGSAFLTGLIAFAAIITGTVVALLRHIGYWDPCMYKIAAFWFIGSGLGAVFSTQRPDRQFFSQLIKQNIALAAVIEFVDNIVTFPLLIELFLIPVSALLVGVLAVANYRPEGARVKPVLTGCLAIIGIVVLAFSIAQVIQGFRSIATIDTGKEFLLPLILALFFLPYLYLVRYVALVQSTIHFLHYQMRHDEALFRFARVRILGAIGLDLRRARILDKKFAARLGIARTQTDVTSTLKEFRRLWARWYRARARRGGWKC